MPMRKFIISDIHGNGDIYDSIMGYLENLDEDVELYINGDLIDRGLDSFRVLMDVMNRIENPGKVKIHYLGGNHELMMYQAVKKRKPGKNIFPWCNWMMNGGWVIKGELDAHEDGEYLFNKCRDFLANLSIYHIFDEKIVSKPLLLVHAQAPKKFNSMKIGDNNRLVYNAVWTRKKDEFGFPHRIGREDCFTIVGHTPVSHSNGFTYNKNENYMNIDGGCSGYAIGKFEYNHVPLLEIENNQLSILVFNHNNEIIRGYTFDGELHKMSEKIIQKKRKSLSHKYNDQEKLYKKKILENINK